MQGQVPPSKSEEIFEKVTEILFSIRKQSIQKHFTNILFCHLETIHILLLQNPWIKIINSPMTLPQILDKILIVISNIKTFVAQLVKNNYFAEIGQNKAFSKTIAKIVEEFDLIQMYFKDTSLSKRLIDEELHFKNLTPQLNFIDEISIKLTDKYKDYKNMLRSSSSSNPGELSIIFDLSYMPNDECTLSWMLFSMKLTSFIYDLDKTELTSNQLGQIRKLVDSFKVSAISFDTLNLFFNYLWVKTSERRAILNNQDVEIVSKIYSVIIDESPILQLTYSNHNIIIHPRGYDHPSNINFRGDGITYFGRKNQANTALNDVYICDNDLTVSRKQFQIVYREDFKKYVLLCISNSNPTNIKIIEKFPLKLGSLIQLSDSQIFKVENIGYSSSKKSPTQYLQGSNEIEKKINNKDSFNSSVVMKKIFETKFDILVESMFFSVLELDPPDLYNDKNLDLSNKTAQIKFTPSETTNKYENLIPKTINNNNENNNKLITISKKNQPPFIELVCLKGQDLCAKTLTVKNASQNQLFLFGRKPDNDIVIDSQDLSSVHCQILYDSAQDTWFIGEKLTKLQEKYSVNGTYVFCKDFNEYTNKRPSQAINLEEGMIIKVSCYEIHVHLED